MMDRLKRVVANHPDEAKEITDAFMAVLYNPERDIEMELYGKGLDEEEIMALNLDVIAVRYGEE